MRLAPILFLMRMKYQKKKKIFFFLPKMFVMILIKMEDRLDKYTHLSIHSVHKNGSFSVHFDNDHYLSVLL